MRPTWVVAVVAVALAGGFYVGNNVEPVDVPSIDFDGRPEAGVMDIAAIPPARVQHARRVAKAVWGQVCNGLVKIRFAELPGNQSGEAAYQYDPGNPLDTRRYGSCRITVTTATKFRPAFLCAVIVHEWGHLRGHGHSRNPRAVMYPVLTRRNLPDACH